MIPANRRNRKARVNLTCPTCRWDLSEKLSDGFVRDGETYCCQGCAEGAGCACLQPPVAPKANYGRRADLGQRNPENTPSDRNFNEEVDTSGHWFGNRKETKKAPPKQPKRGDLLRDRRKAPRSQSEERPSTREQARGRSEMRGSLNKGAIRRERVDRVSRTGSKGA